MTFRPPILDIAELIGDPVEPADFPDTQIRFRNDRWAQKVGLGDLSDDDWSQHFGRFTPLPNNLPNPMALRYHGHQFGTYNPQLGDGRGFLFAQLQADDGRVLDLGTKGSGQTPYSRQGDGRLTLKGAVREILASSYLEALGVSTSKTFSVIETGEQLWRNDEPSPTRSAVMVRLQHSHIRFGSFQRLAYKEDRDGLASLLDHVASTYYPDTADLETDAKVLAVLSAIAERTGRMIGQWLASGFVHGVMNTDNFNVTGETFDFGPYRFLPVSDPNFTAAYFDETGLYRFGRQPTQGMWALQQLASALLPLATAEDLASALGTYSPAYQRSFADQTLALLGLEAGRDLDQDLAFLQDFYSWMTESGASWSQTFFDWFGGAASEQRAKNSPQADLYLDGTFLQVRRGLEAHEPDRPDRLDSPYFQSSKPVSMTIEAIEALWAPIAESDDWSLYSAQLEEIESARKAYL